MGTGSSPGVKRPGRGVDHPPHLAPRLKKEQSYTSTPPLGLRGHFIVVTNIMGHDGLLITLLITLKILIRGLVCSPLYGNMKAYLCA
jgi:hypothetical protein